jgi:hypothetical protein
MDEAARKNGEEYSRDAQTVINQNKIADGLYMRETTTERTQEWMCVAHVANKD